LPPAPEPALDGPPLFHIAAIDVSRPDDPTKSQGPAQTILAYVLLTTPEQRKQAEAITEKMRNQQATDQAIDADIRKLGDELRAAFRLRPEPLVLRVAAPPKGAQPVKVSVRLTNLLPRSLGEDDTVKGLFAEPVTSLRASLARHATDSDGGGVGANGHSLVVRGDSRTYLWHVDRELGACYLRDGAIPGHQSLGLFGALVIEPPGSYVRSSAAGGAKNSPGCQAAVTGKGVAAFREFVLFIHDGFHVTAKGNAINYYAAPQDMGPVTTPALTAHTGDAIRVRLVHAAGHGENHAFFFGGRRWPFDRRAPGSNHAATVALGPAVVYDLRFEADRGATKRRTYLYGSRVAEGFEQLTGGEWGLFQVLPANDPLLWRLE
jgi:hypothetical protein